jgi:hypothetical protein
VCGPGREAAPSLPFVAGLFLFGCQRDTREIGMAGKNCRPKHIDQKKKRMQRTGTPRKHGGVKK